MLERGSLTPPSCTKLWFEKAIQATEQSINHCYNLYDIIILYILCIISIYWFVPHGNGLGSTGVRTCKRVQGCLLASDLTVHQQRPCAKTCHLPDSLVASISCTLQPLTLKTPLLAVNLYVIADRWGIKLSFDDQGIQTLISAYPEYPACLFTAACQAT